MAAVDYIWIAGLKVGKRRILARYTKRSLKEYKANVSVGSGVFYDRFDGDECLENVLVAGK